MPHCRNEQISLMRPRLMVPTVHNCWLHRTAGTVGFRGGDSASRKVCWLVRYFWYFTVLSQSADSRKCTLVYDSSCTHCVRVCGAPKAHFTAIQLRAKPLTWAHQSCLQLRFLVRCRLKCVNFKSALRADLPIDLSFVHWSQATSGARTV